MENKKKFGIKNFFGHTNGVTKKEEQQENGVEFTVDDIDAAIAGLSTEAINELILSGQPINEQTIHQVQEAHRKLEEDKKKVQKGMRM